MTRKVPPHKDERLAEGMRPGRVPLSETDAASCVRKMFSQIAPRYDFLNHLLSFSLDRLWRRRVGQRFRHLLARSDARVLDLCCGTGDLTFALDRVARSRPDGAIILGCDFAHPMLVLAQSKNRKTQSLNPGRRIEVSVSGSSARGSELELRLNGSLKERASAPEVSVVPSNSNIREAIFVEADALQLPFAGEMFDLVTAAFGFRNLANYEAGLREIWRVLKSGGGAAILEFSLPSSRGFGRLWRSFFGLYFRHILPRVGTAVSGVAGPYQYLPDSVYAFPLREKLVRLMEAAGFVEAGYEEWTGGIVAMHTARRPV